MKNSIAEKQLTEICKRLGVKPADSKEFHGFYTASGTGVLYRRANPFTVPSKRTPHLRWQWTKAFDIESRRSRFNYVLLHGPSFNEAQERFFFVSRREFRHWLADMPNLERKLAIGCQWESQTGPVQELVWNKKEEFDVLKEKFES